VSRTYTLRRAIVASGKTVVWRPTNRLPSLAAGRGGHNWHGKCDTWLDCRDWGHHQPHDATLSARL